MSVSQVETLNSIITINSNFGTTADFAHSLTMISASIRSAGSGQTIMALLCSVLTKNPVRVLRNPYSVAGKTE